VNTAEPDYSWFDTGLSWKTPMGGTAYKLNVTSLKWLDESIYSIEGGKGNIWTHEVIVIVPYNLRHTNMSFFWGTGRYNDYEQQPINGTLDGEGEIVDVLSHEVGIMAVIGY